jgi:hypothetical protein
LNRFARILLVAGIVSVLAFLAIRTNESRVRAPAPDANAEFVETRREPGLDAAGEPAPSKDRIVVSPLEDEAPSEIDESVVWRVCVVDARTNAALAGATVSVLDSHAIASELSERGIGFDTIDGLRLRRERAVEAKTRWSRRVRVRIGPSRSSIRSPTIVASH